MKEADLVPGRAYCYKTRNSRYDDFTKKKGIYKNRLPVAPGAKRSRTHVLQAQDGRLVEIDASFIVCEWSEHINSPEYQAKYKQELDAFRREKNRETAKSWAEIASIVLGIAVPNVTLTYGAGNSLADGEEERLLDHIRVNMSGTDLKRILESANMPVPALKLMTEADLSPDSTALTE